MNDQCIFLFFTDKSIHIVSWDCLKILFWMFLLIVLYCPYRIHQESVCHPYSSTVSYNWNHLHLQFCVSVSLLNHECKLFKKCLLYKFRDNFDFEIWPFQKRHLEQQQKKLLVNGKSVKKCTFRTYYASRKKHSSDNFFSISYV